MKRTAFSVLCAFSLVLCISFTALWVRSYNISDNFWSYRCGPYSQDESGRQFRLRRHVISSRGGLQIESRYEEFYAPLPLLSGKDGGWQRGEPYQYPVYFQTHYPLLFAHRMQFAGFELVLPKKKPQYMKGPGFWERTVSITVPIPALVIVTSLPPLFWARSYARTRRKSGHCFRCGYDLRATPDRCPECGFSAAAL